MIEKNKTLMWTPLAVSLFALLLVYAFRVNTSLFYAINSTSLYLGTFWVHMTLLGDGLLIAILMIPFVRKHYKIVWAMLWTAVIFNIILHSLKNGLNWPRPPLVLPTDTFFIIGPEHDHRSFPSGHTTAAFAYAGVVALGRKNKWLQLGLFGAALLVGLSRIGVGVHWPTDVLAGLILGWSSAWIGYTLFERISVGNGFLFQLIIAPLLILSAGVWLIDYNTHYPQADGLRYGLGSVLFVWGLLFFFF